MCFTKEVTLGMMAANAVMGTVMHKRVKDWRCTQLFVFFFLMELLQFLQHFVLDDCGNWLNQATTILSWIHVCFQPVSVNLYLFRNEPNKDVTSTVFRLGVICATLGSLRLSFLALDYLPSWVFRLLPGLPNLALTGTDAVCSWEAMCGPQICTRTGNLHMQWTLPFTAPSYYFPSAFVHFLMMFVPGMLVPGAWLRERQLMSVAGFLMGPFASHAVTYAVLQGRPEWRMEWPGVWCLYSAALCVVAGVGEILIANTANAKAKFAESVGKPGAKPVVDVMADSTRNGRTAKRTA